MLIAIYWPDDSLQLPDFLRDLPYPVIDHPSDEYALLTYEQGCLGLLHNNERLVLDWVKWWYYHYQQRYKLAKEPLARAIGIKGNPGRRVWDITCGQGKDSLLMLSFGAAVTSFEKSPVVAALLKDALIRAKQDQYLAPILEQRFSFHDFDPTCAELTLEKPEVIYLDPMYVATASKAKPNLAMQFFRGVLEQDDNLESLFAWTLGVGAERIVIKRAIHAPLMNPNPKVSYRGKSTRYDMYITSEVAD